MFGKRFRLRKIISRLVIGFRRQYRIEFVLSFSYNLICSITLFVGVELLEMMRLSLFVQLCQSEVVPKLRIKENINYYDTDQWTGRISTVRYRNRSYFIFVRDHSANSELAIIRFNCLILTRVVIGRGIFPIPIRLVPNAQYTFCLDGPSKRKQSDWQYLMSVAQRNIRY